MPRCCRRSSARSTRRRPRCSAFCGKRHSASPRSPRFSTRTGWKGWSARRRRISPQYWRGCDDVALAMPRRCSKKRVGPPRCDLGAAGRSYASCSAERARQRGCSGGMAILTQTTTRPGWWTILTNFWVRLDRDHVSIMAAGTAVYALLSIFPGMSALISIYGLVADPATIETQLNSFSGVLPQEALKLLSDQLHALVAAPRDKLGLGLLVSLLIALWSATSGTGSLMQALTVAYWEGGNRGILSFYGRAIALTIGVGGFALLSLFLIAGIPAVIGSLPLSELSRDRISLIRWPLLAILAVVALGVLYRYGPARRSPCWNC